MRIIKYRGAYAVVRDCGRDREMLSTGHASWHLAEGALRRIEARETRPGAGPRPCLRCARTFESQGRHNRLCDGCRGRNPGLPEQMLAPRGLAGA